MSNQMSLGEIVTLRGWELALDLIVFDMFYFNVIWDMDLLSQYRVEINYKKKNVQFNWDDGNGFTFGESHVLNMMISSVKTRKMLSKRCPSYLTHIVSKVDGSILSLQDTLIMYEFQDMFLDNFSRLALERKVEFNIELASRIVLIFKAPYLMALTKY